MLLPFILKAQDVTTSLPIEVDYNNPKTYIIGGVTVEGIKYLNQDQIIALTGMQTGDQITVPSEELSSALKRIWMQRYFSDVALYIDSLSPAGDTAFLKLKLTERPRVSRWDFSGIKNSERDDLKEKLNLRRGGALSEYVISSSIGVIKNYLKEKGFLKAEVSIIQANDSIIKNAVRVTFDVKRGPKVKVKEITYEGVGELSKFKLDHSMKKTKDMKWYNFFVSKKFNEDEYENDKQSLIDVFKEEGYRDAKILKDSVYYLTEGRMGIHFIVEQGKKYYFRNITWTGNSEYAAEDLNLLLKLKKGDVYDVVTMQERLFGGGKENEMAVSKAYRDKGYLFFNVVPVELNIDADSVDVEMRVVEGKPATFNNIIINGNTITNEKVVRRAVFTRPGYLFRQTDFERSIREIASMGNFDAEKAADPDFGYSIMPNPMNNTVDIAYNVEEKADSKFELSGGWGASTFVGTLGVSFNNFSAGNLFRKEAWRPVPLGDAQQLAVRFQTNGTYYTALTASFVEPWLFGKKPTSLNISAYFTRQTNSYMSYYYTILNNDEYMEVFGASIGLGTRLKWPDNYFILYNQLGWQTYKLQDWSYNFIFDTGISHNLSWTTTLSRNSTDQTIYPRSGSDLSASLQLTPPYSLLRDKNIDYDSQTDQERYKWIEYHKWTFKGSFYTKIIGDLVLMTRAQFGYLGYYNRKWGYSPFEGFIVGGDGMSGYNTYGSEVIALRGYENYSLTPYIDGAYAGNLYDKFTVELRYPIIMQPQSTIYALAFLEGGNCWSDIRDFNPFQIKRSAGIGLRVLLPIVGMLGIDWGYGFDTESGSEKGHFHFLIGQQF